MRRTTSTTALVLALAGCAGPTTYDDVAPLRRDAQLAAFVAASPAERAAMYPEPFPRLAAREGVTAMQRDALTRAAALVSPDWYTLAPEAPGWAERVKAPREEMERL